MAVSTQPIVVRVSAWKRYRWLLHGFSTRPGGVSTIYAAGNGKGELNLGFTTSDSRENVLRNREIFLQALLEIKGKVRKRALPPLVLVRQIHSGIVYRIGNAEVTVKPPGGDGMMTDVSALLLGILTADCMPILVADVRKRVVAAFHAGWRGTAKRIVERGVGRMRAEYGCKPEDLTAVLGPGIGPCCYAVGDEVRGEFDSQFTYSDRLFREVYDLDPIKEKYPMLFLTARAPGHSNLGPSTHVDLVEANRRQLLDAGLRAEAIHATELCTACHPRQLFSHRGEHGFTGRMMGVVGIRKQ